MTVFSSFLIQRKFPTGFLYQAKQFAPSDLLLFWGIVGLCAGAWSLFYGLLAGKISDYQQAEIKLLERQKQDLQNRLKKLEEYNEQLRCQKAQIEGEFS